MKVVWLPMEVSCLSFRFNQIHTIETIPKEISVLNDSKCIQNTSLFSKHHHMEVTPAIVVPEVKSQLVCIQIRSSLALLLDFLLQRSGLTWMKNKQGSKQRFSRVLKIEGWRGGGSGDEWPAFVWEMWWSELLATRALRKYLLQPVLHVAPNCRDQTHCKGPLKWRQEVVTSWVVEF